MKFRLLSLLLTVTLLACNGKTASKTTQQTTSAPTYKNKGHELVSKMVEKVGSYNQLLTLKDVVYTLTYQTADVKTDIVTEKYLFDGQLSYGLYKQHQRTLADLEGPIEQGFDGQEFWLKQNGKILNNPNYLKKVAFNRPTNFYWFTMFQKLLDPGVNYTFVGEQTINNTEYHIVKISFETNDDKPTDIYQLYINKNTLLVDQFLFTVADYGMLETPLLMQLQYQEIEGMLLPTQRQYKKSTWDATINDGPWIHVNWSNIQFNNQLSPVDFKK
ncbi:DUF6503 family protein [Wenyingzhuangia aestuarii]|uniref:DUF6503 family protein n=1 Tax=Wenyingzhuangia aestuarii TaxID=1647582 RepID=UPI00143C083F|nr:DUF6503 family protein [Wenyingzhuangia aestuarii]NJB84100.1 hypothetical protein [Wenyingzhuangia aestuarii]